MPRALILLLLVQAGLGGLTVLDQNSPWSVALHLEHGAAAVQRAVADLRPHRPAPRRAGGRGRGRSASPVWLLALGAMASAAMIDQERRLARLLDLAAVRWRADPGPRRSARSASTSATACWRSASASACWRCASAARGRPDARAARRRCVLLLIAARDRARRPAWCCGGCRSATALLHQALGVAHLRRSSRSSCGAPTRRRSDPRRRLMSGLSRA